MFVSNKYTLIPVSSRQDSIVWVFQQELNYFTRPLGGSVVHKVTFLTLFHNSCLLAYLQTSIWTQVNI